MLRPSLKIVVLGARCVGKSTLVDRFTLGSFSERYQPSCLETRLKKTVSYNGTAHSCEIIDTVGQEEFFDLKSQHIIGIHGYILVYSVVNRASFDSIQIIYDKILDHSGLSDIPAIIVGNQVDLRHWPYRRQIDSEEGKQFAEGHGAAWIETSALRNENVDKVFKLCLAEIEKRNGLPTVMPRGLMSIPVAHIHDIFAMNERMDELFHEDVFAMTERLDKLLHEDKVWYTEFVACRGTPAQVRLNFLQDILDYDLWLAPMKRRRLFKALLRLSRDSELSPRCFTLTGLQRGRLVAGGSFGDVYKGLLEGQSIAVKMMRVFEESDVAALLTQFSREALIWRQFCHPNLLPFFGLYYFQQRLCLVSPWMENGHIRAFLKKEKWDTKRLLPFILDVALGLEHLHESGVVHGDLKGDNIFVTPLRRACIADFGLSSMIASESSFHFTNSSKQSQGGTIRYQAPELHRGGNNDLRSDIYGFACLVYEMLAGNSPFPELRTDGAVINAVLQGRRPSQPKSCSGTPSLFGLWNLVQECWNEQPSMRPTAAQVVARLTGPEIQAKQSAGPIEWDHSYTSRFRRRFILEESLPSVSEFEGIVFGDMPHPSHHAPAATGRAIPIPQRTRKDIPWSHQDDVDSPTFPQAQLETVDTFRGLWEDIRGRSAL
ncbi:kinase-like domain-containing protein [Mycena polygramma]|nr:kinase-like domain-containing protein [Mycena polygramma]